MIITGGLSDSFRVYQIHFCRGSAPDRVLLLRGMGGKGRKKRKKREKEKGGRGGYERENKRKGSKGRGQGGKESGGGGTGPLKYFWQVYAPDML